MEIARTAVAIWPMEKWKIENNCKKIPKETPQPIFPNERQDTSPKAAIH
jgi:hypothetical protein